MGMYTKSVQALSRSAPGNWGSFHDSPARCVLNWGCNPGKDWLEVCCCYAFVWCRGSKDYFVIVMLLAFPSSLVIYALLRHPLILVCVVSVLCFFLRREGEERMGEREGGVLRERDGGTKGKIERERERERERE